MAHYNQEYFVRYILNIFAKHDSIIVNVGSANVNGSLKKYKNQVDIDLDAVEGVNVVANASSLPIVNNCADIYISSECYEHNPTWKKSIDEALRILKDDGLGILTVASLVRYEHGTKRTTPHASPGTNALGWNYYKNLYHKEIKNQFEKNTINNKYNILYNYYSSDLYVIFVKNPSKNKTEKINEIVKACGIENTLIYQADNWGEPLKLSLKLILSLVTRLIEYNITNEFLFIIKKLKIKK